MEEKESRPPSKVVAFKGASEADQRLVARLVKDRETPTHGGHDPSKPNIDIAALADVFRRNVRDITDIANIFKVMPDLNLPRDILVSAICSPGDLSSTTLIIESKVPGADSQLISMMVDVLTRWFIEEKETQNKVHNWIDEALILRGSHPILILPEASIDRMVNGDSEASMESVANYDGEFVNGWFKPNGFLGLGVTGADKKVNFISMESARGRVDHQKMAEYHTIKHFGGKEKATMALPIQVTDNLAVLRRPAVQELKRQRATSRLCGDLSLESRRRDRIQREKQEAVNSGKAEKFDKNMSDSQIYSRFFRPAQQTRRSRMEVIPTLKQAGGKTVGHAIEYHLPAGSVVPVCIPGDRENHVGYWLINDGNGFPAGSIKTIDYYDDVRRGMLGGGEQVGSGNQIAGELLNMATNAVQGGIANASDVAIDRMAQLCGDIIERDLMARLKTGVMGGEFELARTDYIDKLMLARTLKNQQTTLLYIPAELMVYMAYDYNEYGVGKSILEDAKGLCAMRANLMVANVMGAIANAIPGKDIDIELDPRDKNPIETVGFAVNEALALAFNQLPMAMNSPQGIAEGLQMTSYSVNVSGNSRFPGLKTTIRPRESQQVAIETDTLQQARDDVTRVFSVTPEMVDNMNQPEFATTAVNNSLLLLKRVMMVQRQTNPMLGDYVRISTMNDGILIDELLEVVEQNKKLLPDDFKDDPELFVQEFINGVTCKLPAPDIDNLEKHIELYDKYEQTLDKVIAAYLKDEYLDGYTNGIVRESLPTMMASWKGKMLREFMRSRGLFREMDVFGNAEDGSPLMELNDEMAAHAEALNKALGEYSKRVAKDAIARRKRNDSLAQLDEKARAAAEAQPIDSQPQDEQELDEDGNPLPTEEPPPGEEEEEELPDDGAQPPSEETPPEEEEEEEPSETPPAAKPDGDDDSSDDDLDNFSMDLPPAPKI